RLDLHVLVTHVEQGSIQAQTIVEPVRFDTQLEVFQLFRRFTSLQHIERRSTGGKSTAAKSGGVREVAHEIVAGLEAQAATPDHVIVSALAATTDGLLEYFLGLLDPAEPAGRDPPLRESRIAFAEDRLRFGT